MKRCPKCNRTYSTDTQKFCTHDGGLLAAFEENLGETIQFDSSKVRDAVQKPTTRDLGQQKPPAFDPEATVVRPAPTEATQQGRARDTGSLEPPQPTQYYSAQSSAPAPAPAPAPSATPPPPTPSAPTPPQTGAPLPQPQTPTSGPIAPPAPAQAPSGPIAPSPVMQAAVTPQPSQPLPPVAPAKKKSKLPLILGVVAIVLVLFVGVVVAAGYWFWKRQASKSTTPVVVTQPTETAPSLPSNTGTPGEASKPSNEPPPYNPPADAVQFVNSPDALTGKLADNFIAFSFYYPDRWVKVPSSENFVTVERRLPPDFTQENFAVAPWYSPEDTSTFDEAFFQKLAARDDANFAKRFPEYRKVSEGPTKVGAYDGYEFRFQAMSRGTDKGDVTLWGREIFFPPREGEKTGVKFLILTTSLAPELKSIDDVGVKGELPMILESFRFGK
jgi:hypothetical protein